MFVVLSEVNQTIVFWRGFINVIVIAILSFASPIDNQLPLSPQVMIKKGEHLDQLDKT